MAHKIVPESKYPGMYRIVLPDGSLSDVLNLCRAKDTAVRFEHIAPAPPPPPPPLITGPRIDITISPCLKPAMMGGGMVHRDEYDAYLGDRLVCSSWTPFFDAARVLIAEGHDPEATLVMRHRGSDHDVLWAKLRYAATLTVSGNYFVPYRPPPPS